MVNVTVTNHFQNATNLKDLLAIPNATTGGMFWIGMLFMMWGIIIMAMIGFGVETAMLTASFVILIAGMFLVYLGLVSWTWLMTFLGIILFTMFYMIWQKNR